MKGFTEKTETDSRQVFVLIFVSIVSVFSLKLEKISISSSNAIIVKYILQKVTAQPRCLWEMFFLYIEFRVGYSIILRSFILSHPFFCTLPLLI